MTYDERMDKRVRDIRFWDGKCWNCHKSLYGPAKWWRRECKKNHRELPSYV